MKYLKFTYVDAVTGIPVTQTPAANGPRFPAVDGLEFMWARESQYPTNTPEFFGTCPEESKTNVPGVLAVLSQADWESIRHDEMRARIPQSVTMRQARLALLGAGLLAQVDAAIASMPGVEGEAARIEWEYATEVRRSSPLVSALGLLLALDKAALDELFVAAVTI